MKRILFLAFLGFSSQFIIGQSSEWLQSTWIKTRNGESLQKLAKQHLESTSFEVDQLMAWAEKDADKLRFVFRLLEVEINSTTSARQQELCYFFVDKGLTAPNSFVVAQCIDVLKDQPSTAFHTACRGRLSAIIRDEVPHKKEIIKLAGLIQLNEVTDYFYQLIQSEDKRSQTIAWNARLALAKMGDVAQTRYCIDRVKAIGMSDQTVHVLVPDLIYIGDRRVVDYLMGEIASNEKKCTTTDPDNEVRITCAYRLVELMAPLVMDFPYEVYPSGDIVCDDYEQMLNDVRQWVDQNREVYRLVN